MYENIAVKPITLHANLKKESSLKNTKKRTKGQNYGIKSIRNILI